MAIPGFQASAHLIGILPVEANVSEQPTLLTTGQGVRRFCHTQAIVRYSPG
jgi:hypothetical protein